MGITGTIGKKNITGYEIRGKIETTNGLFIFLAVWYKDLLDIQNTLLKFITLNWNNDSVTCQVLRTLLVTDVGLSDWAITPVRILLT